MKSIHIYRLHVVVRRDGAKENRPHRQNRYKYRILPYKKETVEKLLDTLFHYMKSLDSSKPAIPIISILVFDSLTERTEWR